MKTKIHIQKRLRIICLAVVLLTSTVYIGTYGMRQTQENQEDDILQRLDNIRDDIKDMEDTKDKLTAYMQELNQTMKDLGVKMKDLDDQLQEKQNVLNQVQEELSETKEEAETQYEEMKLRIQYIYENRSSDFFNIFIDTENYMDFLNRADFVSYLSTYDRSMLDKYTQTLNKTKEKEEQLATEKMELEEMILEAASKQEELMQLVKVAAKDIDFYAEKIVLAQGEANNYEEVLREKQNLLEDMMSQTEIEAESLGGEGTSVAVEEATQKESSAPIIEETTKKESVTEQETIPKTTEKETESQPDSSESTTELELLAALIECEAGGEPYEGQVAVGAVVMNRVKSGKFPNSIVSVIYHPGQFAPVTDGSIMYVLAKGPKESCLQAAKEAISGYSNIGDSLYFKHISSGQEGIVIGNHVFY